MNINGPIWKTFRGIMVLGMAFSPLGMRARTASPSLLHTTSSPAGDLPTAASDCSTQEIRITLASEQIKFCSPTELPFNVVEDSLTDPKMNYAGLEQLEGYGIVNIRATSPGFAPGPGKPIYHAGELDEYRQALWDSEKIKNDRHVSNGPWAHFWGEKVAGIQIDLLLSTSQGDQKLRTIEWSTEHNGRLWSFILTWDTGIKNASSWVAASNKFNLQTPVGEKKADTAFDLGKAYRDSQHGLEAISASGGPVDVTLPAWWDNEICDYSDYYEGTGIPPVALGLPWHGVYACGTNPPSAMVDFGVTFYPGGWGQFEWECVELINRFLYQEWGINPIHGSARQLKDNLPTNNTVEFFINNGIHSIIPGDIITEDASTYNPSGHAMVVIGKHIDIHGEEYVDIMEQNTGAPQGRRSIHMTAGVVDNDPWCFGQHIQGWLHVKANQASGDADTTFALTGAGLNGPVTALGFQSSNNNVIAGGDFTAYDTAPRNHIVQINSNGSLDTAFAPVDGVGGTGTPQVFALNVQSDQKFLLGGYFDRYDNVPQSNLARLNTDGKLDSSFNDGAAGATFANNNPASVNVFAIQSSDGKILVGGNFNRYNGEHHHYIARISGTDGAVESVFTPNPGGPVYAIAVLPDDKILVGGDYSQGILRLDALGTPDTLFNASPAVGANGAVRSIALQEDKVYIAGNFSTYNGVSRNGIARLNSDGSLDTTFNPGTGIGGTSPYLTTVLPQPDGRILIGGSFSTYNGSGSLNFARLNNDGSLDATFLSRKANDGIVNAILLQPDGKILVGGAFTGFIVRLLNQIEPCYSLTTQVSPSAPVPGGTVTVNTPPNCPGGKYIAGSVVHITATPNTPQEFKFIHWSGGTAVSTNPMDITISGNTTITANFLDPPHAFNKLAPSNGANNLSSSLTLSWQPSAGAASYEYCLDSINSGLCDTDGGIWTSTGSNTSISLSNLFPSITYHWNVRARNQVDTTHAGQAWYFSRDGFASVPMPISPTGVIFDTQPSFAWNISNGADSYHLVIEAVSPPSSLFDGMVNSSACMAGVCPYVPTPALILPLGDYRFKLSSHTAAGYSSDSSWQYFSVAVGTFLPFIRH